LAIDLHPAGPGIARADFLTWTPPAERPIAVIGNPPYGVNGSGVSAFIRRACLFADMVAYILPLSYAKPSMHARWPKRFHLVAERVLPTPNAMLAGVPVNTRNVFQVWERREVDRVDAPVPQPVGWRKVPREQAQYAMRTHGVGIGRLSDPRTANASSHLFFLVEGPVPAGLADALKSHNWPSLNMGQPSVGARDYVPAINAALRKT
jgi:hypothetical protein